MLIFDRELGILDRLLWLLVVVAFLTVAAAITKNFWSQWRNEQVQMKPLKQRPLLYQNTSAILFSLKYEKKTILDYQDHNFIPR